VTQIFFSQLSDRRVRERVVDVDTERHRSRHSGLGPRAQLLAGNRNRPLQEVEVAASPKDLPLTLFYSHR
jgi:hypothetical protein